MACDHTNDGCPQGMMNDGTAPVPLINCVPCEPGSLEAGHRNGGNFWKNFPGILTGIGNILNPILNKDEQVNYPYPPNYPPPEAKEKSNLGTWVVIVVLAMLFLLLVIYFSKKSG